MSLNATIMANTVDATEMSSFMDDSLDISFDLEAEDLPDEGSRYPDILISSSANETIARITAPIFVANTLQSYASTLESSVSRESPPVSSRQTANGSAGKLKVAFKHPHYSENYKVLYSSEVPAVSRDSNVGEGGQPSEDAMHNLFQFSSESYMSAQRPQREYDSRILPYSASAFASDPDSKRTLHLSEISDAHRATQPTQMASNNQFRNFMQEQTRLPPLASLDPTLWAHQPFMTSATTLDVNSPTKLPLPAAIFVRNDTAIDHFYHYDAQQPMFPGFRFSPFLTPPGTPLPQITPGSTSPQHPPPPATPTERATTVTPTAPAPTTSPAAALLPPTLKPRKAILQNNDIEEDEEYQHSSEDAVDQDSYASDGEPMIRKPGLRGKLYTPDQKRKAHKAIEKRRRQNMNLHFDELRQLMAMEAPAGRVRGICKGDILAAACKYIAEMNEYCKTLYSINVRMMAERGAAAPDWILDPVEAQERAVDVANGKRKSTSSSTGNKGKRSASVANQEQPAALKKPKTEEASQITLISTTPSPSKSPRL